MRFRFIGVAAVTCAFLAAASPSTARMNGVEAVIKAQKKEEPAKKSAAAKAAPKKTISKPTKQPETRPESQPSEAPQPPIIVIDPGHGGKDPGAIGSFGKKKKKWIVREKDVVLQMSKQLAAVFKKKLGAKVSYTRSDDRFITLGERNRIANRRQCDLFLSVHANAAKNPKAEGLEIYSLNKATDEASRRLAARENEGAPAEEKDIEAILSDLLQTAVAEESVELASDVETALRKRLEARYKFGRIESKTALFYVLVGAKCPSLLIETGFVTNEKEGKRLKQGSYQKDLANAIAEGVAAYLAKSEDAGGDL
ncbi:MAG TPA: N-acetylmuramoyl-L-alanine amidase [bacterium]|nr:N-acetylmuramoyl-L-alanine amidase [bacterium]